MAFARSVAAIGSMTMISRLLGFVRDSLFAAVLGAGPVADCFFVAFRLPNFFRALFAEGAFSAAFVPVYTRLSTQAGRDEAQAFTAEIATILVLALIGFCGAVMLAMPLAMHALAPGFSDEPAKFALAVELTRLTFPYLAYISLVSLFGAVLNANQLFRAPAATPIIMNLVLIAGLVGPARRFEPAHSQAVAVTLSGICQFLWLVFAVRRAGLSIGLARPRLSPEVRRFFKLLAPATIGAGIYQVNVFVGMVLSSLLPSGAVSYLFYADRLSQLPLGVIGVAMSTALLPLISRHLARGEEEEARAATNRAVEGAILLALPAAAALIAVPAPIIAVLFERGAFTPADTHRTALTLAAYAAGLPAFVIAKVFQPGFYAREDTKAPVRFAAVAMLANVACALVLIWPLAQLGIALATTVAAWVNALQLGFVQWRRGHFVPDARLKSRGGRLALASLGMTGALVLAQPFLAPFFHGLLPVRIAALLALVALGAVVYGAAALALRGVAPAELKAFLRRGG